MRTLTHFLKWSVGLANAETQTTSAERDCLAQYAAGRHCLVEIGVWHGVSTRRIRNVMATDGVLYAVDPYPVGRLGFSMQLCIARREIEHSPRGNVVWVRETGASAAAKLKDKLASRVDFIFIDGDHSYEGLKGDWLGWTPLIARGGIIALHDSRSTPERSIEKAGSVVYTQEVVVADPRFEILATVDSLSILRRK
ncbi:MAG: class I SAM-dependent methyltransferase [Planctomycetaceae bacterium]|nr:class I SAM-dependent methyltransferase [Planctomycetaceae bacterium]